jgi:hypothetical protein
MPPCQRPGYFSGFPFGQAKGVNNALPWREKEWLERVEKLVQADQRRHPPETSLHD